MKKLGRRIGLLLGLFAIIFVGAALIVPLVVDVDKYRPQIQEATNQKINGSLELGKLKLSLWGQIRIERSHMVDRSRWVVQFESDPLAQRCMRTD